MNAATAYQRWAWDKFLKELDRAGYAVVKKPEPKNGRGLSAQDKAKRR